MRKYQIFKKKKKHVGNRGLNHPNATQISFQKGGLFVLIAISINSKVQRIKPRRGWNPERAS